MLGPDWERFELLEGEIIRKMGQNQPHIGALRLVAAALRIAFGDRFDVGQQVPLRLGERDFPEPDITVLKGTARDFANLDPKPEDVALLVEIADTRLDTAQGSKVRIYATHGIQEYWVLDLRGRRLSIYRRPRVEQGDWHETLIYTEDQRVSPLGIEASVLISDLLP